MVESYIISTIVKHQYQNGKEVNMNEKIKTIPEKKFYSDIRFVKIENLKGRAHQIAEDQGLKKGLALLKVSVNSVPEYEIQEIKGDPLIAIKDLAARDGITQEKMNKALEEAFPNK